MANAIKEFVTMVPATDTTVMISVFLNVTKKFVFSIAVRKFSKCSLLGNASTDWAICSGVFRAMTTVI